MTVIQKQKEIEEYMNTINVCITHHMYRHGGVVLKRNISSTGPQTGSEKTEHHTGKADIVIIILYLYWLCCRTVLLGVSVV